MGKIAGAFATSHILMSPTGVEERARRVVGGMKEIGRRVVAARPDIIVIVSTDHMFNINMGLQPPFAVGVADEYVPFGDMEIPRVPFPGHRAFAEAFVERAAEEGFDLAKAEEYAPDHGVALPLLFANPERRVPVVPILVNINMQPIPAPKRCLRLAGVLRESIERDLPAGARAVVLGTGGLSHWLNVPGMGTVNTAFDRKVLDLFAAGRSGELGALSVAEIVEQGGNGGIEIVTWMMAAATCPGAPSEEIYYEAMPEWFTGMGGIALRL